MPNEEAIAELELSCNHTRYVADHWEPYMGYDREYWNKRAEVLERALRALRGMVAMEKMLADGAYVTLCYCGGVYHYEVIVPFGIEDTFESPDLATAAEQAAGKLENK